MRSKSWLPAASAAAAFCVLGGAPASAASIKVITPYADPLGGTTDVHDINAAGWMTGSINRADTSSVGFLRDPSGHFTTFSIPFGPPSSPSIFTQGRSIDASNNVTAWVLDGTFITRNGAEAVRAPDGSVNFLQGPSGLLHGIPGHGNDAGAFVGDFADPVVHTIRHGYVQDGATFTQLDAPGSTFTSARGINDDGTIVGWFNDPISGDEPGFIYSGGVFQVIDHPGGALTTNFEDINDNGVAVGGWHDAAGNAHPFMYDLSTGVFTDFTLPGGAFGTAWGIDDAGRIVMSNNMGFGTVSYLYDPNGVPEPATWTALILGFGLAGAALRRNRTGALGA